MLAHVIHSGSVSMELTMTDPQWHLSDLDQLHQGMQGACKALLPGLQWGHSIMSWLAGLPLPNILFCLSSTLCIDPWRIRDSMSRQRSACRKFLRLSDAAFASARG